MMSRTPMHQSNPVDIELSNSGSVSIVYIGGATKYRYDIYEDHMIIGAMGIGELISNVKVLEDIVIQYISMQSKF